MSATAGRWSGQTRFEAGWAALLRAVAVTGELWGQAICDDGVLRSPIETFLGSAPSGAILSSRPAANRRSMIAAGDRRRRHEASSAFSNFNPQLVAKSQTATKHARKECSPPGDGTSSQGARQPTTIGALR
jgi:hypothetical protein